MNKLIITKLQVNDKEKIFSGLHDGKRFFKVNFDDVDDNQINIGDIYVCKVKEVVKNISAAFVEFIPGEKGYLSLDSNNEFIFMNNKNGGGLVPGDELLVQLVKLNTGSKYHVVSSGISLSGEYIALNLFKTGVGCSNKIKDSEYKKQSQQVILKELDEFKVRTGIQCGAVIRTNAYETQIENVIEELHVLEENILTYIEKSKYLKAPVRITRGEKEYNSIIKGAYTNEIQCIVTDQESIYNELLQDDYIVQKEMELKLYEDNLQPLYKLYDVEGLIKDITKRNVWLKSGGNLVIDTTEAMTVIDVNSAKFNNGKSHEKTSYKINLEAAKEIIYQLTLRNISGIIIVDFINMTSDECKENVLEVLRKEAKKDRIKTVVVDMTKLNLVEITRKRISTPVNEQIK